jgi:hypothetical protein
MNRMVIELTVTSVDTPLVDHARAFTNRLGVFSTFEKASAWLASEAIPKADDEDGILYYEAREIALDPGPRDSERPACATWILERDGRRRGLLRGDMDARCSGREPSTCKFKPRDLVGFVYGDEYRVGVVMGLPLSPDEVRTFEAEAWEEDVYLVGLLGPGGVYEHDDHDHPHEAYLFEVESDIPEELRVALQRRYERSRPLSNESSEPTAPKTITALLQDEEGRVKGSFVLDPKNPTHAEVLAILAEYHPLTDRETKALSQALRAAGVEVPLGPSCSFCGQLESQVRQLFAGGGSRLRSTGAITLRVMICDQCVGMINDAVTVE